MKMKQLIGLALIALAFTILMSGCVTVKPYERENLADRTMDFDKNREEVVMEQHFLLTREGSIGGNGGAGGGCACN